ncbi:branched-chain amino acid aminotransferase [Desulfatibacillum alkenivorans DSM 16219]|jgi:branched-chain amino acid aminotransferase/para-aminobenzoate synthetase component 1|uniref:Branched-chain amino acid aminotransferase n=1 Tax=Desulfatibacillum alkenivorans DSM 16219 TaxID=1121393 RepID=A0A1M6YFW6_9BACT|nr:aminotransferase class IV [Desulfatibacillum alkenivorans]SHL17157.1 branched-chain amino acid aminotransferase [Desulfatibacillum alkenivorans DSM 16219]
MSDKQETACAPRERIIWLNGEFLPESQARISPLDRGLLFGDGLFETIRAQNGAPIFLEDHLERIKASARRFNLPWNSGLEWNSLLTRLIRKNNLQDGLARLKIVLTRGCAPGLGLPHAANPTCMALAENYLAPASGAYAHGWDLYVPEQCLSPPLSGHKTLNYLYYMATKQEAIDNGCHEALILDKDGMVAETCTANLLTYDINGWYTPATNWRLPGTAFKQVERLLKQQGHIIRRQPVMVRQLANAQWVWAVNCLMGVMPVRSIGGKPLASLNNESASALRAQLFMG